MLFSLLPFFFCYLLARNCECLIIDLCFSLKKQSFSNVSGSGRFRDFVQIFRCSWVDLSATLEAISIAVSAEFFYYIAAPAALINFSLGSEIVPARYVFYSCFCFCFLVVTRNCECWMIDLCSTLK